MVFEPDATRHPRPGNKLPAHGSTSQGHVCFHAADSGEKDRWRRHLAEQGIAIQAEWADGGRSIYIRDPAGNSVACAEARIWGTVPPKG